MGPGFESQRDHFTGQVAYIVACPVFFLSKSLVQTIYYSYGFVQSCGSKILAFKREFFEEDRTNYLTFLYCRGGLVDFVEVCQVINSFVERRGDVFLLFRGLSQLRFQDGDLFFAFCLDGFEVYCVNVV